MCCIHNINLCKHILIEYFVIRRVESIESRMSESIKDLISEYRWNSLVQPVHILNICQYITGTCVYNCWNIYILNWNRWNIVRSIQLCILFWISIFVIVKFESFLIYYLTKVNYLLCGCRVLYFLVDLRYLILWVIVESILNLFY